MAHGRSDRVIPLPLAEELAEGITGADLRTFPGGHMFFMLGERASYLETVVGFATHVGS